MANNSFITVNSTPTIGTYMFGAIDLIISRDVLTITTPNVIPPENSNPTVPNIVATKNVNKFWLAKKKYYRNMTYEYNFNVPYPENDVLGYYANYTFNPKTGLYTGIGNHIDGKYSDLINGKKGYTILGRIDETIGKIMWETFGFANKNVKQKQYNSIYKEKTGGSYLNTVPFAKFNTNWKQATYGGFFTNDVEELAVNCDISNGILIFDFENTNIKIDGTKITSSTVFLNAKQYYKISTTDDFPIRILSIRLLDKIKIDQNNAIDFEYTNAISSTNEELEFGIYQDTAMISFEYDKDIMKVAAPLLKNTEQTIKMFKKSQFGVLSEIESERNRFIISKFNSDVSGTAWTVNLENIVGKAKNENYIGMPNNENNTLESFFDNVFGRLNYQINNIDYSYFNAFKIPDGFLEPQKKWDAINKLCQIAMVNCSYKGGVYQIWRTFGT